MENAASVPTTLGGGNHGHLALVMNPARYLALSGGAPFIPPRNPGPVPVPPTPFMTAAQMELLRQTHQADLASFHTCNNTDTALKNQLLTAVDDIYLAAIKQEHIGYTNRSCGDMLTHLFNTYGTITSTMLRTSAEKMRTPYNPAAPIEEMFKQIDEANDLALDANSPYQDRQLVNIGYDLVFRSAVLNDACRAWKRLPDASQTWAQFKLHFSEAHDEMQEMQTAAQEMGYATVNFSLGPADSQTAAAEALQALADATTEDRTAVANLSHTNGLLNEQVVNLTRTITTKDSEIEELRKSISELSTTIRTLAPTTANRGDRGGRGGRGNKSNNGGRGKTKKKKSHHSTFTIVGHTGSPEARVIRV